MNKLPSTPIKIAAFFFLVGGLLSLMSSATHLTVETTLAGLIESFNINQLINIIIFVTAILEILVGWYLIQLKRWSYILGLILVILGLGIHIFALTQVATTRWYSLALSATILILLIVGRKDFKI